MRLREWFLAFIEERESSHERLREKIQFAFSNKNFVLLQVQDEKGRVATLSGWIVRVGDGEIMLRSFRAKTFVPIAKSAIRKLSVRKK